MVLRVISGFGGLYVKTWFKMAAIPNGDDSTRVFANHGLWNSKIFAEEGMQTSFRFSCFGFVNYPNTRVRADVQWPLTTARL